MRDTTEQTLSEVFRAVLQLDGAADVTGIRQVNQPSWDSLAHVSLMAAIESEFSLTIDITDSLELTSFAAVALYLEEQGL